MPVRGIRGATVVSDDRPELVLEATRELIEAIVASNQVAVADIASIIFTTTPDIRSAYPAHAGRALGWVDTALLGAVEMDLPSGLPRCIRVLMHVNDDRPLSALKHIYLHDARSLRPDR